MPHDLSVSQNEGLYDPNGNSSAIDKIADLVQTAHEHGTSIGEPRHTEDISWRVALIQHRSQRLSDHEITVYDKALLELTQQGQDCLSSSALWFVGQYYSPLVWQPGQNEKSPSLEPPVGVYRSSVSAVTSSDGDIVPVPSQTNTADPSSRLPHSSSNTDPRFVRLWKVFEDAVAEYIQAVGTDSGDMMKQARFLRDTAENTLDYVRRNRVLVDPRSHELLQEWCNAAAQVVTNMAGKKRTFDESADAPKQVKHAIWSPDGLTEETSAPRSSKHSRYSEQVRRDVTFEGDGEHYTHGNNTHNAFKIRGFASRHSCPRRIHPRDREVDRSSSPLLSRPSARPKVPMRGRGHSGIPFGYSRDVDSWAPHI